MTARARIEPRQPVQLRILIVDDDPMTLLTLRRGLQAAGHQTSELTSGFGFTMALRDFEPHVVLLDVNMPGLGGIGALRSARELFVDHQPRILLHSGALADELHALATELEVDGYVCKPASLKELVRAVETLA